MARPKINKSEELTTITLRLAPKTLKKLDTQAKKTSTSRQLILSSLIARAVKDKQLTAGL